MRRLLFIIPVLVTILVACGKKNDMVLDTDEMASLMADIHIAEAVVDLNHDRFRDDSDKMVLKQSIYEAHGVTASQVDSSYAWYGYHIEDYMKVYEKTVAILNERQSELLSASTRQITIDGDSVDIWPMSSHFEFSHKSPSRLVTFSIPADSNWHNNDVFSLRFNMVSANHPLTARMVVEYADGTSYYNLMAGKNKGRGEVTVRVDTTLSPVRIAGYIIAKPDEGEIVRIDSVSLIRMRKDLSKRYFSLRPFNYGITKDKKSVKDTVATDQTNTNSQDSIPPTDAGKMSDQNKHRPTKPGSNHHGHSPNDRKNSQYSTNNKTNQPATNKKATQAPAGNKGESAAQKSLRERDALLHGAQRKKQTR